MFKPIKIQKILQPNYFEHSLHPKIFKEFYRLQIYLSTTVNGEKFSNQSKSTTTLLLEKLVEITIFF